METFASRFIEVDLHCLVLRFAHLRLGRAKALETLVRSIERDGQLTPVVAVTSADQKRVLIDGYLRVEALRRCGQDTVRVDVWPCDMPQALMAILAQAQQRPWQSIEEAHLIQELHAAFGYSQHDMARQIGRDVSWVNRRLALIALLPDDLQEAVRQEQVSTWAASRILLPLARANTDHAQRLLVHMGRHPLSTRDLHTWFQHYQRANRSTRTRMVDNPGLFLEALRAKHEAKQAKQLKQGPEGAWLKDLQVITTLLQRLRKQVATLFEPAQSVFDQRLLWTAFNDMMAELARLQLDLKRYDAYDPLRNPTSDPDPPQQTHPPASDQSSSSDLPGCGASSHPSARASVEPDG